jgi:hypothetical protein
VTQNVREIFASLVQETKVLLEEESFIIADEKEAQYFRLLHKKKIVEPIPYPSFEKKEKQSEGIGSFETKTPLPSLNSKTPPSIPAILENKAPLPNPPLNQSTSSLNREPPHIEKKEKPSWIHEESSSPIEIPNFATLKSLFQKKIPQIPIVNEIPNDQEAKKIGYRWKTKNQVAPISVLYLSEPSPQKELLVSLTKAIDVCFGSCRLISAEAIEKEKQWEAFLSSTDLKWVIVCDYTLWQLTELMRFYKELPAKKTRHLKNVPLFLLPDLSLYLKDPHLKRSLWKALCQILSS